MTFNEKVELFKAEWLNESKTIEVRTSGSTGESKIFCASKEKMRNSALMTCEFLGLRPKNSALLCMPVDYIAGKMMVVRSLVTDLQLVCVEPQGNPLCKVNEEIDFVALTPMQVFNTLKVSEEARKLSKIKHVIIGGGAIDKQMAEELKSFPNNVWSTYGMTETLSHIAMRRLSGSEASEWYTPLRGVKTWLSERGTLCIDAPMVCDTALETNDIAETREDGTFRIVGRTDNTINSGGIKIQIEEAERLLQPFISKPFAITSVADKRLGEAVTIVSEDVDKEAIISICRKALPKYWQPQHVLFAAMPRTGTGKPDRCAIKRMAEEGVKNNC